MSTPPMPAHVPVRTRTLAEGKHHSIFSALMLRLKHEANVHWVHHSRRPQEKLHASTTPRTFFQPQSTRRVAALQPSVGLEFATPSQQSVGQKLCFVHAGRTSRNCETWGTEVTLSTDALKTLCTACFISSNIDILLILLQAPAQPASDIL